MGSCDNIFNVKQFNFIIIKVMYNFYYYGFKSSFDRFDIYLFMVNGIRF